MIGYIILGYFIIAALSVRPFYVHLIDRRGWKRNDEGTVIAPLLMSLFWLVSWVAVLSTRETPGEKKKRQQHEFEEAKKQLGVQFPYGDPTRSLER